MSRPDTFIVGAPRCGTTWLFEQLGRHPDVAPSRLKEPTLFGSDLQAMRSALPDRRADTVDDYLALFPSGEAQRTLEASAIYLFSRDAIAQIAAFEPNARLIAMVRDPIDQIRSLHGLRLRMAVEADPDPGEALDHEVDRRGERLPLVGPVRGYPYRAMTRYAEQLERAFESFPHERVHIVVHDDLQADPVGTLAAVLQFLDLSSRPPADLGVVNARDALRSRSLGRTLRFPSRRASRLARTLVPSPRLRTALRARLTDLNRTEAPPLPLDLARRRRLAEELRPDVDRLAALLDRDLGHWMGPGGGDD